MKSKIAICMISMWLFAVAHQQKPKTPKDPCADLASAIMCPSNAADNQIQFSDALIGPEAFVTTDEFMVENAEGKELLHCAWDEKTSAVKGCALGDGVTLDQAMDGIVQIMLFNRIRESHR